MVFVISACELNSQFRVIYVSASFSCVSHTMDNNTHAVAAIELVILLMSATIVCFNCDELGRESCSCDHVPHCCICKSEEHNARLCPYS